MTAYSNVTLENFFVSENSFMVVYSDILKSICSMEISEDSDEVLFLFVSLLFSNNVVLAMLENFVNVLWLLGCIILILG